MSSFEWLFREEQKRQQAGAHAGVSSNSEAHGSGKGYVGSMYPAPILVLVNSALTPEPDGDRVAQNYV
jgi:hypothetical protein